MRIIETLFDTLRHRHAIMPRPVLALRGARAGAKAYLLARCVVEHGVPLLVITPDTVRRDALYDDLRCFLSRMPTAATPRDDPGEVVCRYVHQAPTASDAIAFQRQRALETYQPLWRLGDQAPIVVVAAVEALRYGVIPPQQLTPGLFDLRLGVSFPLQDLAALFVERGYRRVSLVETVGEFALRGGILDVFSPPQVHPVRIEFFGDEVETIRTFDVQSQTSIAPLSAMRIAPMYPLGRLHAKRSDAWTHVQRHLQANGWHETVINAHLEHWRQQLPSAWPWGLETFFYDALHSLLAYLPPSGLLCCVDVEEVQVALQQLSPPDAMHLGDEIVPLPENRVFPSAEITQQLQNRIDIALPQYDAPADAASATTLQVYGAPQFFGAVDRFIAHMEQWRSDGFCVLLVSRFPLEMQRLQHMLATYDLGSRILASCRACLSDESLTPGAILLSTGHLHQGFVWSEKRLVILRAEDIFGDKPQPATSSASRARQPLIDFGTLRLGDSVVHIDYGIGRYRGMTFLDVGRKGGEFMELEYADGAKLYVPSYRLNMVQKYSGGDVAGTHLDRLGGNAWARAKARVKTALLEMAEELVEVHAARQNGSGYSFSSATALHQEFENGFEYAETEDQLRVIQEVLADMEEPRPMERLVCGDVGYGKTEVALRAAFKAAYDGKQVAVLVPTTVLAQQHYETFQSRFASYPVQIGMLSRLRSRKEQSQTLAGLQQGAIDIVIGTHRLLQKDIHFKALGLLVVDEEHRFGVRHKEQIKRLSHQVDVLALTATPIPRSLHMALVSLRDCSIIATPPEGRSAIETVVAPYAEEVITQAIQQELARGGQVFFVHNRIDTLPALQAILERLVPACRVGIAHGQMPERMLETMMLRFLHREFDLLLCTTIIESGLDIPSVNTIIINHAESFGLAQLYQLRGRVGRSTQQAYAYLLIPGDALLSKDARQRIEAIEEFSALGSGFQLASRDLEIRGAGNLLGAQQSGHIASVGFDLYCQMMEEAIHTARGEAVRVRIDPELRLDTQGYIPEAYVDSETQRLALYRRMSMAENQVALDDLQREVVDRFGPIPEAVRQLFAVMEIKMLARQLALERIEQRRTDLLLTFHPQTLIEPEHVLSWLQATAPGFRLQSEHVVRIPWPTSAPEVRLALLKERLQQLCHRAKM